MMIRSLFILIAIFTMTACSSSPISTPQEEAKPELRLTPVTFSELSGWKEDDLRTFVPAFSKSCTRILKNASDKKFGALDAAGNYGDWQEPCRAFLALKDKNASSPEYHAFFEEHFTPHIVSADDEPTGLFTGYYEASLKGSRIQSETYNTPLYKRADDLVMVQLGEFREDLKGRRVAGRVVNGKLKPYETREQIVSGDYPNADQVLVWVDDPIDAFFVQIQGSGIVELAEGGTMRIGYAAQNGHPYFAIGRELIERGALTKENVSLQTIRAWLEANSDQAGEVMNTNKSYVFFKELEGEGPIGGEGVSLTAGRSLAIDRSLLAYGMPIWTDIAPPIDGVGRINKLMVTQDTGGAIRGPVRGDVFWGYGDKAETLAGPMKPKGRYWVLLPK